MSWHGIQSAAGLNVNVVMGLYVMCTSDDLIQQRVRCAADAADAWHSSFSQCSKHQPRYLMIISRTILQGMGHLAPSSPSVSLPFLAVANKSRTTGYCSVPLSWHTHELELSVNIITFYYHALYRLNIESSFLWAYRFANRRSFFAFTVLSR